MSAEANPAFIPARGGPRLGDEMEAAAGGAGVGVVGAGDGLEDVAAIFGGRAMGPILSMVQASAMAPVRLTRP